MSIKSIFSLGGVSTPNMMSLSTRRQILAGPLHIRPSDSLVMPVTCIHTGATLSVLQKAETHKSTLQKIRKNEAHLSLSCAHIYCLTTPQLLPRPSLMGTKAESMHSDPSAACCAQR